MGGLRLTLVALLLGATALFAAGAIAERSQAEPAHVEVRGEHDERAEAVHADADETVLGVNAESTPLIVLAVAAGLGLAALAALLPAALPAIALIALAWAALDIREAAHQSHTGIAVIAIGVATLHLAAAATAGLLAVRARQAHRPGTMPA